MTVCLENETGAEFPFSPLELTQQVADAVLEAEGCPYEAQVELLITDSEGIRSFNRQYRGVDAQTDVLSFPGLSFEREAGFEVAEESVADCFDPDSGQLLLGQIILSADRVVQQAAAYGHSVRREFAFLVAHSMLHLCGYDHETAGKAAVMEEKQERILASLGITRDVE